MIKQLLIAALLVTPVANADDYPLCTSVEEYAELAFIARHTNTPMSKAFTTAKTEAAKEIVIEAYSMPRRYSKGGIETAKEEFKAKWYTTCIKAQMGK